MEVRTRKTVVGVPPNAKMLAAAEEVSLADTLRTISSGFERLKKSGLKQEAVVILLAHKTRLSRTAIAKILDALPQLAKDYCT